MRTTKEDLEKASRREDGEGWLKDEECSKLVMWRDRVRKIAKGMM